MRKPCTSKRVLSALLAVVLAVGLTPTVPAFAKEQGSGAAVREYRGFSDVYPSDWFAADDMLGYAVDNGLLSGYGNGLFGPYDAVTRAQVAMILWRVAGEPESDAEDFSDVDYSQWYGAPIEWARSTGVVSGYGDTNTFDPEGPVTREQLAVMLSNYAGKVAGLDTASDCSALDAIAGADQVSSWAREQMGWAVDEGVLSGSMVGGVAWVDPQGTAQRCQVAKMASVFHRDVLGLGPNGLDPDAPATVDYADDLEDAGGETVSAVVDGDSMTAVVDGMAGDVQAGDVVMLEASEDLPFGGAMKVESVTDGAGSTTLEGAKPDYGEVYDELVMRQHVDLADVSEAAASTPGVASARWAGDGDLVLQLADLDLGRYGSVKGSITVSDFDGNVIFIPMLVTNYIDVDFTCDIEPSVDVELSALPSSMQKLELFSCPIPYLGAAGCGVYFVVYMNIDVSGRVSYSTDLTLKASAHQAPLSPLKASGSAKRNTGADLEVSANASVGPSAVLAVQVAGWPLIDVGAEAGAAAQAAQEFHEGLTCTDVDAWLYAEVFAELVGEATDLLKATYRVWHEDNSPLKAQLHWEDGELVPECTWGESPEEPSGEETAADDFLYMVLKDDTPGVLGREEGAWYTRNGPQANYCGPGAYIWDYKGNDSEVVIPNEIEGMPVKYVYFSGVQSEGVSSVDVSRAKSLQCLGGAAASMATGLDKASELRCFSMYGDRNKSMDYGFSSNVKLEYLDVQGSAIGALDTSRMPNLRWLDIRSTNVSILDLSNNKKLTTLYAGGGGCLRSLNISDLPALKLINVEGGALEKVAINNLSALETLWVVENDITDLDIDNCSALLTLYCGGNALVDLDISGCPSLETLETTGNPLTNTSQLEAWSAIEGHTWLR